MDEHVATANTALAADLRIGTRVAGYRVEGLLGRGGMGIVYRAKHLHLDRTVALKLLTPELTTDVRFRDRFAREARLAAALEHPHIIPVYDAGEAGGVLYLSMRLVEGPDLAQLIKAEGRLEPRRACALLSQVAGALDAAHAAGLVHRDVKPGNILVANDGRHAYLSDFGLTRRLNSIALTTGWLAGTLGYMAPELFQGAVPDARIDRYALGCVAYTCLTGSPPFEGDSLEVVMAAHLSAAPPRVSPNRPDLPPGVDAVLAKAISKDPARRYSSCAQFATALSAQIDRRDHTAPTIRVPTTRQPPLPLPQHQRPVAWIGALAVLLAMVIALALVTAPPRQQPAERSDVTTIALRGPLTALAMDAAGAVYVATTRDSRVVKVAPSGTITPVAGNGSPGFSGDGGPAVDAQLSAPHGLAFDSAGNLYIADLDDHRVRKVDLATGIITTFAGNGDEGSAGDGGPALKARLGFPSDIAIDRDDNLYVSQAGDHRVRRIDRNGLVTTVAGTGAEGSTGDGGSATAATLARPLAVAVDAVGHLYIADDGNNRVRRVDLATGIITTFAGNGIMKSAGDGGPATAAALYAPDSLTVDQAGNVYITEGATRVRRVDAAGTITTFAGTGRLGFSGDGGPATSADFADPNAVLAGPEGTVYIADSWNHRLRKVDPATGTITTVAGVGPGYPGDGRVAVEAFLSQPFAVDVDGAGQLFIADAEHDRIRRVGRDGLITTVAGNGARGDSGDGGLAVEAQLSSPMGVVAGDGGVLYLADSQNHRVRMVTPDGRITTVAGNGTPGSSGDGGPATDAQLTLPVGLALDSGGNLYIADPATDRVRRVDPAGTITTVAGTGRSGFSGDGGPATRARLAQPTGVHVDPAGNLYIADTENHRVRKVDPAGTITTIAGTGLMGFSGDGGPATQAQLARPTDVHVDPAGSLFIADWQNNRIRKVDPAGTITTIAGTGVMEFTGDGGPATAAALALPAGVTGDSAGNLYLIEQRSNWLRKIDPTATITTIAGWPQI